jgi:hypothetical protein
MFSKLSGGVQAEQGFRLKIRLQPEVAVFASDAGLLETAKGCRRLVGQRVDQHDVAAGGYTADRATLRQKKTGRPVRFELTEHARQAVDENLRAANKTGEFLVRRPSWSPKEHHHTPICALVSDWIGSAGLDPRLWDAFTATHQSDPDLSAHRKSQGGPASARAYQDRLCPVPDYVPLWIA